MPAQQWVGSGASLRKSCSWGFLNTRSGMMEDDARQVGEGILRRLEEAWNAADGAGFAAPFTDDADFVAIRGDHHRTRAAIAAGHQQIFDTLYRGSTLRYSLTQARRLA